MDFTLLVYLGVGLIIGVVTALVYERYWRNDFNYDMNAINSDLASFHLKLDRLIDKLCK